LPKSAYEFNNAIMVWKIWLVSSLPLLLSISSRAMTPSLMNTPTNDVYDKRLDEDHFVFLEEESEEFMKVIEDVEREELASLKEASKRNRALLFEPDENLWQPIHEAARSGYLSIIKYLVEEGADINALTATNDTPLDLAVYSYGEVHPIVKELQDLGALSSRDILNEVNYYYYDEEDNEESTGMEL
jgi:hypothetical protein